ncbi:hypothetical protein HLB03_01015, partial [Acidianus sp. DSM 29099]|nr:hypothetical protein [Acidianus sp. RZ1]
MIEITLTLRPKTFYSVTSLTRPTEDRRNEFITDFYKGFLSSGKFLPSSSIKGMLRTASVFAITTLLGEKYSCEAIFHNKTCGELNEAEIKELECYPCPICRTYGTTGLRARCKIFYEDLFKRISNVRNRQINFLHDIQQCNILLK